MNNIVSLLLTVFMLVSCGKSTTSKTQSHKSVTYNSYSSHPILIKKQQLSCDKSFFELKTIPLQIFDGEKTISEIFNFENLLDGTYVRDPQKQVVKRSIYGESVWFQNYEYNDDRTPGQAGEVLQFGTDVTVCPEVNYLSDSVEAVALNAMYFVNKTNRKIKEVAPELSLKPIKLNIGPLVKVSTFRESYSDIQVEEVYWVDNASYSPITQSISYYPQSAESIKLNNITAFWEVPMVTSHEYGHHLFNTIFPYYSKNEGTHVCFDNRKLNGSKTTQYPEKMSVDGILTSLNEGFADLISYYTLDETERSVRGLECMEKNRDVGSSEFADQTPKVFSYNARFNIFDSWNTPIQTSCREPNFRDSHIVGAIFASIAERYMNLFTTSNADKLKILIAWVKEMRSIYAQHKDEKSQNFLKLSMQSFFRTAPVITNKNIDRMTCKIIDKYFSGISNSMAECQWN